MQNSSTKGKLKKMAENIAVLFFWLAIWEVIAVKISKEALVPSPLKVAARLLELCGSSVFWRTLAVSCFRVMAGFALGFAAGVLLGLLCASVRPVYRIFSPLLRVINATPVASFIILAAVWIFTSRIPIFITFLMVLPVAWNNTYAGITSLDSDLMEMTKIFKLNFATRWKTFYLPSLMPYIRAVLSMGINYAWKSGIAAEIIVLPALSIGKQIKNSKMLLETVDLFAWTIAVIILSFMFEKLSKLLLKAVTRRAGNEPGA